MNEKVKSVLMSKSAKYLQIIKLSKAIALIITALLLLFSQLSESFSE